LGKGGEELVTLEDREVLKEGISWQLNLVEEPEPVGPVCVSFGWGRGGNSVRGNMWMCNAFAWVGSLHNEHCNLTLACVWVLFLHRIIHFSAALSWVAQGWTVPDLWSVGWVQCHKSTVWLKLRAPTFPVTRWVKNMVFEMLIHSQHSVRVLLLIWKQLKGMLRC